MCGILAIASGGPDPLTIEDRVLLRMRDAMEHRGPDDRGVARLGPVALAQTRLAVIDPTPAGHQPMNTGDGRFSLVYNGEIYNDSELRQELKREGAEFRGSCDAETVLVALEYWGEAALDRLRGMYALVMFDAQEQTLLLARDPLGIKPLYIWQGSLGGRTSVVCASEIPAILAHGEIPVAPDTVGVLGYLTTLRTSLLRRTMFDGIQSLMPGERVRFDLDQRQPTATSWVASVDAPQPETIDATELGRCVEDSVVRHLRSDVPMCCLLSGGVDSSIIAMIASEHVSSLHTYCAGALEAGVEESPDFAPARLMSQRLGTDHTEVPITRSLFLERWKELVDRTGSVISTPNEVAIYEVASAMRRDGHVVTLSGEGADELFGGYTEALDLAHRSVLQGGTSPAAFQLDTFAWMPRPIRGSILHGSWFGYHNGHWPSLSLAGEDPLLEAYCATWDRCVDPGRGGDPLVSFMRFHRHINLSGLLRRLDAMTMLASVEGRTPLADAMVARIADALPSTSRHQPGSLGKLLLREAFSDRLPEQIVCRPKAGFPLPFAAWIHGAGPWLADSARAREIFTEPAIQLIVGDASANWQLAWPMINVALWADRWF